MKVFVSISIMILVLQVSFKAQESDSADIRRTVSNLFDAMRKGDSAMLHNSFHKDVRMFTSFKSKEGEVMLEEGGLNGFLVAVGTPHENIWDEQIWNVSIRIDDNIAHVWCDYGFYVDSKFSHCGVDAFQLVKNNGESWQIINLIDTRKKVGCFLPSGK